ISITLTDAGSLTAATSFELTVNSINDNPIIGSISNQTTNEDTVIQSISIAITDIETATCIMAITLISTDTSLFATENMTYTCLSENLFMTLTPNINQTGTSTIIIIAEDDSGLTVSTSFDLTVTPINDIPVLSAISSQNINEGTFISLTITATDVESNALTITAESSDQNLIPNDNITIINDMSSYSITITPAEAHAGSANITISVSDGTDITEIYFSIVVDEVYYIIAGHISYYTDISGSVVEGVTMTLRGTHSYEILSDISGDYTFAQVRPGDYTLTASKSLDISGLMLNDAIKILNASVRSITLTCHEQIAADANMNGFFSAMDASKIAIYNIGLNSCMNTECTFWRFFPEIISSCDTWPLIEFESVRRYTDLTGDVLGQDFIGVRCGDVAE
ncbi:hypothetical protein MHK_006923, partial [Candidatus Magnetomorum sp. HK-1]